MSHGTGQDLLTSGLLSALGFSHLPENDLGLLTISELIPLIAAVIGSIALTITIIKAIYHFTQFLKEARAVKKIKDFPIK